MKSKILFIKLGALGDLSFALPAPTLFKKVWPECHFTWVVGKSVSDFLKSRPEVDRIVEVNDKDLYGNSVFGKLRASKDLLTQLESSYDLILIAHRNLAYSLILRPFIRGPIFQLSRSESQISKNLGIKNVVATPLVTHESLGIRDLVLAGLALYAPSATQPTDPALWTGQIPALPQSLTVASTLLKSLPSQYVLLQMGGAGNLKTEFRLKAWEHWSTLIKLFLANTEHKLVFIGAPSETQEIQEILDRVGHNSLHIKDRLINVVGKTTLPELERIIAQAKLAIGIDSGPLHVADALRVPCIAMYGPSSSQSWGFLGANSKALTHEISCSPCYKDDGKFPSCHNQHRCMTELQAERVFHEALQSL